jgi:hypothetical protein
MATGLAMENVEKEKKILEKSRNETAVLFDNLAQKFVSEMEAEKQRLKEEISALSLSPLSVSIPHHALVPLSTSSHPSPLTLRATAAYTMHKHPSPQGQGQGHPSPLSYSSLPSPAFPAHAKLEQISSPESRSDAHRTDRLYEESHTNLALTQESLDNNFARLNKKYETLKGLPYPDDNPPVNNKKEIEKKQRRILYGKK